MTPEELAVDVFAVHRLTRLVTMDTLTEAPRRAVVAASFRRAGLELDVQDESGETVAEAVGRATFEGVKIPKAATLVTCRWCASVWIVAGVLVARQVAPRAWSRAAEGLAIASASVLVAAVEG